MTARTPGQPADAGRGRNRARRLLPEYVIEIAISPQLRERDPSRPLPARSTRSRPRGRRAVPACRAAAPRRRLTGP
jgi:hypothetical protein